MADSKSDTLSKASMSEGEMSEDDSMDSTGESQSVREKKRKSKQTENLAQHEKKSRRDRPTSPVAVTESWADFFMHLAFAVSLRSNDTKSRVGCVIVSPDTLQILSTGYNGYTPNINKEDTEETKETKETEETEETKKKKFKKSKLIVHAEANAVILKGHMSLKGAYAFVTLFPCLNCAIKLIQARIKRVYFLSLRNNDSTKKSWKLLKKAGVELIPYPRDSKNGTPEKFGEVFIGKLRKVHECMTILEEKSLEDPQYADLRSKYKGKTWHKELKSRWENKDPKMKGMNPETSSETKEINPFDLWENWFMCIAMTAAMKSTKPDKPEGCILVDHSNFKICGMSYRGFPQGIESTDPELKEFVDETEVSAITNALSLKFKEGEKYYCFATHFPNNDEAKYIAQAYVTKLFFICPAYTKDDSEPCIDAAALKILDKAGIKVIAMTGLGEEWINDVEEKIAETLRWHKKKEKETKTTKNFSWPTFETFRGLDETAKEVLTLVNPLILGGKGGIKPSRD